MKQILFDLAYDIYWDEENKTAHILTPVKTYHLNLIRCELLSHGYIYENIVIGRPDV
jgi:hypothetical protein